MGLIEVTKLWFKTMFGKKEHDQLQSDAFINEQQGGLWDVLEHVNIGVWEWHMETDRVIGSRAFYRILGIEDAISDHSKSRDIVGLIHSEYRDYFAREIEKAVKMNLIGSIKLRVSRPDGKDCWVNFNGMIQDHQGMRKAYGVLLDVTESQNNELRLHENLDFFQMLMDGIPFPIFYKDENCIYQQCNQAFSDYLRTPKENIIDHTVFDISPQTLANVYQDKDAELIQAGGIQHYQSKVMQHTGDYKDVEFYKSVIEHGYNHQRGIVGIIHDITQWKEAENQLQKINKLKDSMLEISQIVLGLNDLDNVFEIVIDKALETIESADVGCVLMKHSDDYLRILSSRGYLEENNPNFQLKIEETYAWAHVGGQFDGAFIIDDIQQFLKGEFPEALETNAHKSLKSSISTPIFLDGELAALVNVDSYENHSFTEHDVELMNYIKAQVEMTLSNLKLYQETVNLSQYDTLTGAYNRSYFDEMLENFITKAERYHESFDLVLFDLDQLKNINEHLGHRAGDELLRAFVDKLKENLRESDFLARYGGDEFVAVFFESTHTEIAEKLDRLNQAFSEDCFEFQGQCFGCSFSYGISQYPEDGKDYPSLFSALDHRLGVNKHEK